MSTQPAQGARAAIVTGGSRGIGRQCAERLAADGVSVVVNYAGNEAEANAAVAAAEAVGAKAFAVKGDVADDAAMAAMFDQAEEAFGGIDAALFLDGKDEDTINRLADAVPLERLGTPADIAEVVAFLTSPAGHWINGQTIRVNGGLI
jgi:NAD(P)-dependent dehydrogenase (short-subunit alcohol dehydrogenase family)